MDSRISQLPFDLRLSTFDFMPIYGFAHATSIIRQHFGRFRDDSSRRIYMMMRNVEVMVRGGKISEDRVEYLLSKIMSLVSNPHIRCLILMFDACYLVNITDEERDIMLQLVYMCQNVRPKQLVPLFVTIEFRVANLTCLDEYVWSIDWKRVSIVCSHRACSKVWESFGPCRMYCITSMFPPNDWYNIICYADTEEKASLLSALVDNTYNDDVIASACAAECRFRHDHGFCKKYLVTGKCSHLSQITIHVDYMLQIQQLEDWLVSDWDDAEQKFKSMPSLVYFNIVVDPLAYFQDNGKVILQFQRLSEMIMLLCKFAPRGSTKITKLTLVALNNENGTQLSEYQICLLSKNILSQCEPPMRVLENTKPVVLIGSTTMDLYSFSLANYVVDINIHALKAGVNVVSQSTMRCLPNCYRLEQRVVL